ncbi:MAG: class I SAM-dependent rRNA methyltransferase, partial [Verrucomicrobiae bacterium]|nr:class I SAM-dependent rRNA methyltransferase [Verrucomicrobiae bacterium]
MTSGRERWPIPWVQLRTYSFSPTIYPAMIAGSSPRVAAGSWVSVYDREGRHFGNGWYNARAKIPLRVIYHGSEPVGEEYVDGLLDRAVAWRVEGLRLDETTDAYRVVNSDGDGISGLIVDRYADVLSVEVHSLAVWQRLERWLPRLHARLGTKRAVVQVDERSARNEGMPARPLEGGVVRVRENGMRFEVRFDAAHKTGFFCDQRENRRRLGMLVRGRRTLDLCCYTGG